MSCVQEHNCTYFRLTKMSCVQVHNHKNFRLYNSLMFMNIIIQTSGFRFSYVQEHNYPDFRP